MLGFGLLICETITTSRRADVCFEYFIYVTKNRMDSLEKSSGCPKRANLHIVNLTDLNPNTTLELRSES
jgi:hypothetical protein